MTQQLVAEQAMRKQDTVALDNNMRAMEGALLQAQVGGCVLACVY